MSSIKTYPDIIEALHNAVNRAGGVAVVAPRMDMAPRALGNLINAYADRSVVKMGLEQAMAIMAIAGDVTPLHMIARELGYALLPLDAVPDKDARGEQLQDVQALARYQQAIAARAPRKELTEALGSLIIDLLQTSKAVEMEREQELAERGRS